MPLTTGCLLCDLLFVLAAGLLCLYVYFKYSYQYWKKKGVPYLEPTFPLGNNTYILPKSETFAGEAKVWYDELKKRGHKFGGVYAFSRSVLVLVDPDYIKDILTQDFQYFTDRDFYSNEKYDPMATDLFNIKNPGWKSLRQKLTPTFTSGKMKMMFNSVLNCSNYMIGYLEKCEKMRDDVNIREVLASFTTDVIGCVAFGIDCNSFDDTHAEFRNEGKDMFNVTIIEYMKTLFIKGFPKLAENVGVTLGKQKSKDFFANAVRESMEYRQKNNIRRPDFLQILIDMNNESQAKEKPFTFEQIVANTILFFVAGFDTSSTVMTFTLYELAKNPDIQEEVRQEINTVLKKYNGEITYEAIKDMTYLREVMDETMRLYPPVISLARICVKDYQLRDTNIIIEKGTPVVISTLGLGRDPEFYPDPMKFDPSRFSREEVQNRHPYIHIPFGEGPRSCIGMRFGEMQAKIGLVRILVKFRLKMSPKTKQPLTIDPTMFLLKENETLYLNAEKIY